MKSQTLLSLAAWLLTALAVPLNAGAQETSAHTHPFQAARYTVTDFGTLPAAISASRSSLQRMATSAGCQP
jgi:hypothetical protein